jgi:hypothetical protein
MPRDVMTYTIVRHYTHVLVEQGLSREALTSTGGRLTIHGRGLSGSVAVIAGRLRIELHQDDEYQGPQMGPGGVAWYAYNPVRAAEITAIYAGLVPGNADVLAVLDALARRQDSVGELTATLADVVCDVLDLCAHADQNGDQVKVRELAELIGEPLRPLAWSRSPVPLLS